MNRSYDCIHIDNPPIPILTANQAPAFGEVTDTSAYVRDAYDPLYFAHSDGMKVHDLYLPHFSMRTIEASLTRNAIVTDNSNAGGQIPGCCFLLGGHFKSILSGKAKDIVKGEQNFKFDPLSETRTWCASDTPIHAVHISISTDHFLDLLPEDEQWAETIRDKMSRQQMIMGESNAPIHLEQQRILQSIVTNPLTGNLRVHMQEALMTQLVLLQFHLLFQKDHDKQNKIHKRDRDLLQAVKDHLEHTFTDNHSLESLSRYFGVNQHKLTTTFRQLFGVSVFEFITIMRMDYARGLLENEGRMVNEVASLLGYKNPHHFATAFKRRFGVNPSSLKLQQV